MPLPLFELNRAISATIARQTLLCTEIVLPTEVSDRQCRWLSSIDEARIGAAISNGRVLDALALFNLPTRSKAVSADDQVRILFTWAHVLLERGNQLTSDRCIQTALRILADGDPSQPGLQFPEWMVLAMSAMLKHDWPSCGLWLQQCERRLYGDPAIASGTGFQKSAGDLFAIRACVCFGQESSDKAEALLQQALKCHDRVLTQTSAICDLVLLSRVLMSQQQMQASRERLNEAQAKLPSGRMPDWSAERLRKAIMNDRQMIESYCTALAMAKCN